MSQYDTSTVGSSTGSPYANTGGDVNMAVVTPTDRVRWGPILAGLFTALSSIAIHGVLGAAIAGSAYDPGDSARSFGIGAGIWGIITVLVSFGLGGWVAARSAAVRGHNNGLLNGAMVWAVAIPMLAYLLAGSAARVAETATAAAGDAAQATANVMNDEQINTDGITADAQQAAAQVTPEQKERVADASARTAWSTLVALLLGLAAAAGGGYLGARGGDDRDRDRDHSRRPATA